MSASRPFFVIALALGLAGVAHAQYELSGGTFNRLFIPSAPAAAIPTQPQFAGLGPSSGGSAAREASMTLTARHPSSAVGIVAIRSGFGGSFAAGIPRYLLGETILLPGMQADGTTIAGVDYWRKEPVKPGEIFVHPAGSPASETPVDAGTALAYYYSPHAGRVFASQAGRVSVKWVTRLPVAIPGDTNLRYRYREEIFAVSSATTKPTRTIYWTERSFNGPVVSIPGTIEAANPVYSAHFPATVATEYLAPGSNPPDPGASAPPEKRTVWFQKVSGIGQLHAYNHEGRIFVEYLGATNPAAPDTHLFLAADILEVARAAPSVNTTVNIGEKITPRDALSRLLPLDAGAEWLPSPVLDASPDAQSYYGSFTRPDGRTIYYAERENENPDRVVFYWLEQADAAIHFLTAPATPNLGLYWPQQRNNYVQRWPDSLADYAHYTVAPGGSSAATGVRFSPGQLPQVVFQDDPAQTEARFDATTQRLTVSFTGDALNRTLLKFTSGTEVWYVRVYTQADARAGFQEGDGLAAIDTTATVADRIDAPAGCSAAGYIAEGQGYFPAAYINPFTTGATAAELGAIIPVNAIPGANTLKVWWFKKIDPPSAAFEPFYVPAKVGRYTMSYPASPATIVMASNAGSGDLPADQIAGGLYVQNDRTQPGFNPNEEHALMLGGRIYALRDDLNNTTGNATTFTSQPFALLRYTAAADQRPALRAFKVLREVDLAGTGDDVLFDYPITAGTIVPPPMPLPLLPLPLNPDGSVRNTEVPGVPDTAPLGAAATLYPHYSRFTFKDRKGYDWVYRGPHSTASPTLGMQFYYAMREGFFVPGVAAQPAIGTVLPYLRPLSAGVPQGDAVTGTALTITYRPVWPANAPELRVAETLTRPKFGLPDVMSQASALVLYEQSIATTADNRASVVLHDPIREKTFALGASGGLTALPSSISTPSSATKPMPTRPIPRSRSTTARPSRR